MKYIEANPWRGIGAVEKLFLITLPLISVVVVALPFLDQVVLRRLARLPGARPIVTWLVNGYNAWLVGAVIILLWGLFAFWVRRRLLTNPHLWSSTGCPDCKERELVRVSRNAKDRFYGIIGIPAYRYACRNCTWRGLRIAHRDLSPERLAELEASLARFDPTGNPPDWPVSMTEPAELSSDHLLTDEPYPAPLDSYGLEPTADLDALSDTLVEETDQDSAVGDHRQAEPDPAEGSDWLWRRTTDA